jgi:Flp pilus assembly protein TadD
VAARYNLAGGLTVLERSAEAVEQFRLVLQLAPDNPEALHNLAWILATSPDAVIGNPAEAVRLAERASALTGNGIPEILETLAVAYASNGQEVMASQTAMRALEIARQQGDDALVQALETRLRSHGALKSAS